MLGGHMRLFGRTMLGGGHMRLSGRTMLGGHMRLFGRTMLGGGHMRLSGRTLSAATCGYSGGGQFRNLKLLRNPVYLTLHGSSPCQPGNPARLYRSNHRLSKANLALLSQKLRQGGGGNPGSPGLAAAELTSGQKSAATKAANKAAAAVPASAVPASAAVPASVPVALDLTLVVTESELAIECHLECSKAAADLPAGWYPNLGWILRSQIGPDGFGGHELVTVTLEQVSAAGLVAAAIQISHLDDAIQDDRAELDDHSLPRTVSAICGHYKVTRLRIVGPDGTGSREVARGQSYRALTQLTDSMLAKAGKLEAA